ncbi:sigma-54 interaction domain-containing protein [Acidicapsa ligni]|uniref:sigma-54 interaction domain-containing protein n=1 Tax=Acidicapsa ligni TaxID=542300 RepID=UPI0021E0EFEF|nr:sigma 54-interacting transcriptional regulator [Acidicapsa ligni]
MFSNNLIGSSNTFRSVIEDIDMVAPLNCAILIQGETGTGKEVVARAVHDNGSRRNKPFVAINCAAIPSTLLESELFGHEKGAFTGAVERTIGRFQTAHGGTLFLDEIGDMPLELQPKLLRVLQEQQFERVGSSRTTQVDVRIIAATNLHLQQMVEEKSFRADLYYRLSVFPIALPPLRQRKGDIPLLVRCFVNRFNERLGRHVIHIPNELIERLTEYHWPGNIRELQNFVERALITSSGDVLTPRERDLRFIAPVPQTRDVVTLADAERAHIHRTLHETNWTIGGSNGAAAKLGIPRTTLISRMEKLGFSKSPRRSTVDTNVLPDIFSPESHNRSLALSGVLQS